MCPAFACPVLQPGAVPRRPVLTFIPSCAARAVPPQRVVDAPPLAVLGQQVASSRMKATALHFALCLALNHTVVMEVDPKTGQQQVQAESPDEEALVDGAKVRQWHGVLRWMTWGGCNAGIGLPAEPMARRLLVGSHELPHRVGGDGFMLMH